MEAVRERYRNAEDELTVSKVFREHLEVAGVTRPERYTAGMVRRDEAERSAKRDADCSRFPLRVSSGCKSRPGKRRSAE